MRKSEDGFVFLQFLKRDFKKIDVDEADVREVLDEFLSDIYTSDEMGSIFAWLEQNKILSKKQKKLITYDRLIHYEDVGPDHPGHYEAYILKSYKNFEIFKKETPDSALKVFRAYYAFVQNLAAGEISKLLSVVMEKFPKDVPAKIQQVESLEV